MKFTYRKKKKVILVLIILAIFFGIGTIVYADYYTEIIIPNKFKTMTYNVTLEEEFNNKWGKKKVTISNNEETSTPVVLRINYNESWSKQNKDQLLVLNNKVNGINVVEKEWTTEFLQNFTQLSDGWYYYNNVLNAKESVQILESVSYKEELLDIAKENGITYLEYDYELTFTYEAIQADENAINEIWQKDIEIKDNKINWHGRK